jgi:hypothetical protein
VSDRQATGSSTPWHLLGAIDPSELLQTRLTLHHAAQLLASFGQALLAPREDDSHRGMTWHAEGAGFASDETDDGLVARLSVASFVLEVWRDGERMAALDLTGRRPSQALSWLGNQVAGDGDIGRIAWPEYDLPPQPGGQDAPLEAGAESLGELAGWYANAERTLEDLFGDVAEASEIRCWPHHFDLATLLTYPASDADGEAVYVGIGFSPGDEAIPDPYYYVNGSPSPAPDQLPELAGPGAWHTEGWVGAVLRAGEVVGSTSADVQEQTVTTVLTTAVDARCATVLATR